MHALETVLRALHPMMPHITEEIWQRVPKWDEAPQSIMISRFPSALVDAKIDRDAERDFEVVQAFVGSARTIRAEHDVPRSQPMKIHWHTDDEGKRAVLEAERSTIETLARCEMCFEADAAKLDDPAAHFDNAAVFVNPGCERRCPASSTPRRSVTDSSATSRRSRRSSVSSRRSSRIPASSSGRPRPWSRSRTATRPSFGEKRERLEAALNSL